MNLHYYHIIFTIIMYMHAVNNNGELLITSKICQLKIILHYYFIYLIHRIIQNKSK